MERYVYELTSLDTIYINESKVAIDSFVSIDDDTVYIDGYDIDSGDDICLTMQLDDVVRICPKPLTNRS